MSLNLVKLPADAQKALDEVPGLVAALARIETATERTATAVERLVELQTGRRYPR